MGHYFLAGAAGLVVTVGVLTAAEQLFGMFGMAFLLAFLGAVMVAGTITHLSQ